MEKLKRIRRTKEQLFYNAYEKIGKPMKLSPTQFANLVKKEWENYAMKDWSKKPKIGYMKITPSIAKVAYQHLKDVNEGISKGFFKPQPSFLLNEKEEENNNNEKKILQNVKRSRGRPKKYETEEERNIYKKISAVNYANKIKLKKKLAKQYNIKINKDDLSYNEAVSYILQRPEHFNTTIINLALRIEPYLKSSTLKSKKK